MREKCPQLTTRARDHAGSVPPRRAVAVDNCNSSLQPSDKTRPCGGGLLLLTPDGGDSSALPATSRTSRVTTSAIRWDFPSCRPCREQAQRCRLRGAAQTRARRGSPQECPTLCVRASPRPVRACGPRRSFPGSRSGLLTERMGLMLRRRLAVSNASRCGCP